jgi:hypothetical protein
MEMFDASTWVFSTAMDVCADEVRHEIGRTCADESMHWHWLRDRMIQASTSGVVSPSRPAH